MAYILIICDFLHATITKIMISPFNDANMPGLKFCLASQVLADKFGMNK